MPALRRGARRLRLLAGLLPACAAQAGAEPRAAVSILQIGDSHTAADLFTGAARALLQARYGEGGAGYLPPGRPHPGVRDGRFAATASAGWRFASIQRSATPEAFTLSGFTASARGAGEVLRLAADPPAPYGLIEIEARTGPGAGAIEIRVDGERVRTASLRAAAPGWTLLRLPAPRGGPAALTTLAIRTTGPGPVTLASIGLFRPGGGVTYSHLGFPGATVDVLARFPAPVIARDLRRLRPDLIVLAFGTNEGFDDALDPAAYRARYRAALRRLRAAAPRARLVVIGPPAAGRAGPGCGAGEGACAPAAAPAKQGACAVPPPPKLDAVRAAQRQVAAEEGAAFWDWAALMPPDCPAEAWRRLDPPLMSKDHIHFTKLGYSLSGRAFAEFLDPIVQRTLEEAHAVPND
ncbi:conserved hypothetical protein [Methylobacterium sp. 4-46]|uniref:GDSL-type esterase/lipase family protein n=1 Tax=unclassified Methylobacterium TaxID=2615210 RepID=UPI000165CB52|nr:MULTISPECIES: GDSL-type esterase/lipase family protein [Methylobacterium]ACA18967.1 conserved hypothetical protein [Methylobacterium sp. 4-46]WFT78185.1 GDSL-type esterase/lipase family protein [Methylobacterium nodulans]